MRDFAALVENSPVPALDNPDAQIAERLVFAVHEGMNWNLWGGKRSGRYWDALAERVKAATYAGPSLTDWWQDITTRMESSPRSVDQRREVLTLLHTSSDRAVLKVLRNQAVAVVLRIQVHTEAWKTRDRDGTV